MSYDSEYAKGAFVTHKSVCMFKVRKMGYGVVSMFPMSYVLIEQQPQ